jgi:aminoglycoside phosphotransferase (APT) family kinase protein
VADVLLDLQRAGKLPERVTHNDTKINNVMIDHQTGEGLCVMDLDTVMPGLALYDFGDLVRTTTISTSEDERDASRVIAVEWGQRREASYEVDVVVKGYDRKWLHKDVTNVIAAANAHVIAVDMRVDERRGTVDMNYALKVSGFDQLSGLLSQLLAVPNVIEARRIA